MTAEQTQPKDFTIPPGTDKAVLKTELNNLLLHLKAGKVLNKDQRVRLQVLVRYLQNDGITAETLLDDAEKAGAYRITADGLSTPKCTKAELELRLDLVAQWVIEARSLPEMVRDAALKWGISRRAFENYISKVQKAFKLSRERRLESSTGRIGRQYQSLYRLSILAGELGTAKDCLDSEAKLDGLAKPVAQRYEFTGAEGGPLAMLELPAKGSVPPGGGMAIEPS